MAHWMNAYGEENTAALCIHELQDAHDALAARVAELEERAHFFPKGYHDVEEFYKEEQAGPDYGKLQTQVVAALHELVMALDDVVIPVKDDYSNAKQIGRVSNAISMARKALDGVAPPPTAELRDLQEANAKLHAQLAAAEARAERLAAELRKALCKLEAQP